MQVLDIAIEARGTPAEHQPRSFTRPYPLYDTLIEELPDFVYRSIEREKVRRGYSAKHNTITIIPVDRTCPYHKTIGVLPIRIGKSGHNRALK